MKKIVFLALLTISRLACGESPLFESDQTLAITIEAPMRDLIRQRMKKPEFDAVVSYTDSSGAVRSINAKLASPETPGWKPAITHRFAWTSLAKKLSALFLKVSEG